MKRIKEATKAYETAARLNPADGSVWLSLAGLYEAQGRREEAFKLYEGLAKTDPNNAEVGEAYIRLRTEMLKSSRGQ